MWLEQDTGGSFSHIIEGQLAFSKLSYAVRDAWHFTWLAEGSSACFLERGPEKPLYLMGLFPR